MTTEPTNNSSIGTVAVIGTGTIGAPSRRISTNMASPSGYGTAAQQKRLR